MKRLMTIASLALGCATPAMSVTPADILTDGKDHAMLNGVKVRKGSIASLIKNVAYLNKALTTGEGTTAEGTAKALKDMRDLIQSQHAFGVFEIVEPQDWLTMDEQPGNQLAGLIYLQAYPEKVTAPVILPVTFVKGLER